MRCPICGQKNIHLLVAKEPFLRGACTRCEFVFLTARNARCIKRPDTKLYIGIHSRRDRAYLNDLAGISETTTNR